MKIYITLFSFNKRVWAAAHDIGFDIDLYVQRLNSSSTRLLAVETLERIIALSPINQSTDLQKLRVPEQVERLETKALIMAGIPEKKIKKLAQKAAVDHAKKYWTFHQEVA